MELQYKLMQIERMVASKIFSNKVHKAMSFLALMLWCCSNLVTNLGVHKWVVTRSLKTGHSKLTLIFTNDLMFSSTSNPMFLKNIESTNCLIQKIEHSAFCMDFTGFFTSRLNFYLRFSTFNLHYTLCSNCIHIMLKFKFIIFKFY